MRRFPLSRGPAQQMRLLPEIQALGGKLDLAGAFPGPVNSLKTWEDQPGYSDGRGPPAAVDYAS